MKEKRQEKSTQSRPPIVAIMGHVDHGKTTLLDIIRGSSIAQKEVGGITQHVRTFQVEHNEKKITFIDTPGHEAFSAIRRRGSQITDVILLVVAADDPLMPQAKEVIDLAKEQNIPLMVAINKVDLPNSDITRIKTELSNYGVLLEGWGGDVINVEISAKNNQNIDQLLDMILLFSDMLELKEDPSQGNTATVLESFTDQSRGNVAVCIVQNGAMHTGDFITDGTDVTRIRSLLDQEGKPLKEATASTPLTLLGFNKLVEVGNILTTNKDKKVLTSKQHTPAETTNEIITARSLNSEELLQQLLASQTKQDIPVLSIILKADVMGSLEAIENALNNLTTEKVRIAILKSGTGPIAESDIIYAKSAKAIVLGFNVAYPKAVEDIAKNEKVVVMNYSIIYELIEDVTDAADSLIPQETQYIPIGEAKVLKAFTLSNNTHIAGSLVTSGKIVRNNHANVTRNGKQIAEGKIQSIRHLKDEVREGVSGSEYGIGITPNVAFEEGDIITCYRIEKL